MSEQERIVFKLSDIPASTVSPLGVQMFREYGNHQQMQCQGPALYVPEQAKLDLNIEEFDDVVALYDRVTTTVHEGVRVGIVRPDDVILLRRKTRRREEIA